MAQEQAETRPLPPYVPYKTFANFIDGLRVAMPSRIDRSLMGTMSGATQGQLLSALRFLGLISENGTPTEKLKKLAKAKDDDERIGVLQLVIGDAYEDVLGGVDIEAGTYRQLAEAFAATGAQGDTVRKCLAFWLIASREADLTVSPHFSVRGSRGPTRSMTKRRRAVPPRASVSEVEAQSVERTRARSRFEVLLEKFPTFDPSWESDVQAKWFTAFERLQSLAPDEEEAPQS